MEIPAVYALKKRGVRSEPCGSLSLGCLKELSLFNRVDLLLRVELRNQNSVGDGIRL